MKSKKPRSTGKAPSLSSLIAAHNKAGGSPLRAIAAAVWAEAEAPDWKLAAMIPQRRAADGSPNVLRAIAEAFDTHTDIPLGLPVMSFLTVAAAYLQARGVRWKVHGQTDTAGPGLWVVNLAPSGAGKTISAKIIEENAPPLGLKKLDRPGSAAGFLADLKDKPNAFLFLDEAADLMAGMSNEKSNYNGIGTMLLDIYGEPETLTKKLAKMKDSITVERPLLGLHFISTPGAFAAAITEKTLLNGTMRRLLFCLSEADPKKDFTDYPEYDTGAIGAAIRPGLWRFFSRDVEGQTFTITPAAYDVYVAAFQKWGRRGVGLALADYGIFRTLLRTAFRYAVIYKLVMEKPGTDVDAEDMDAAIQAVVVHMFNGLKIVNDKTRGAADPGRAYIQDAVRRAAVLASAQRKAGKPLTVRDVRRLLGNSCSQKDAALVREIVSNRTPPKEAAE